MATPLYKFLKDKATSFYAFPSSAEDISASYQNENFKMFFSNYILLNFPKQSLVNLGATQASPTYWDFDTFERSINATPPSTYSEQLIESLRNYVANQEVVIKESRLNNTEFYYDNTQPSTTTEKVFWKWCKKLGLIDFEPAVPSDEYFDTLSEFQRNNINDDSYFPEYLWKEREIIQYNTLIYYETALLGYTGKLEVEFGGTTNFKVGDIVKFTNVSNVLVISDIPTIDSDVLQTEVLATIPAGATQGQRIVFDITTTLSAQMEQTGQAELVYHRLVQYIGDVNGINNVQEANKSYTEVYAHIPDHTGRTPDILFRTLSDNNYKPNLVFPIIPSQYQPEIIGAELFNSPIVSTPQNYPGSYFGQFDTQDFTYEVENGDSIRRSGDYYGVSGDINNPIVDGSTIDGTSIDFNTNHYVKMNIFDRTVTNFDQFNALEVNNLPPEDFDFNAILWYYTIVDFSGNSYTNLYGISFLENPENNPKDEEVGIRLPTFPKLVTNGLQDGSSYAFSLNLNFNIINDNPQDAYNPSAINSLFSMNLFNDAMTRLASINESFLNIISDNVDLKNEISNIKQLLYTQTDFDTINAKITYLESLLLLYKTNQIIDSETISVSINNSSTIPTIQLNNRDASYGGISTIGTTDLYSASGIIPMNINLPENKNYLIRILNNDDTQLVLSNNDKLTVVIDRDLDYKQTLDIIVEAEDFSTQNKKLDIYLNFVNDDSGISALSNDMINNPGFSITDGLIGTPVETLLIGNIDLPVFYNEVTQQINSAKNWTKFNFDIDFDQSLVLDAGGILKVPFEGNTQIIYNSIKQGDTLVLENFYVGTSSVFNFSGQYTVDTVVSASSSYIYLDINSNSELVAYGASATLPLMIHGTGSTILSNKPYFRLNKGIKFRITRINTDNSITIGDRYFIETFNLLDDTR